MKKRIFLLAAFFAFFALALTGQNGKKFYKAGDEFVDNKKYDDAVAQYTSAIGAEPSNDEYYFARGVAYEKGNKNNEAYSDFDKAIVFKSKDVRYLVALARVCNKLGKYDQALVLLNKASGLEKRNSSIYPEKTLTLYNLRKFDQALRVSDTAILIKDDAVNYYNRGLCYVELNNDIIAKKEFEKAISKDRKYVDPRLKLADLFVRNNNTQDAMEQINTVLENDDKNTQAYIIRSKIYKKNLDYPGAINDVSKTILIDPGNPEYYYIRGTYYQEFNQHTNAIADFSKYISLKPGNPDAYYARARSYEEILNPEKAIEDYNKITEVSEFDPRARKMLKEAQVRLFELNRETIAPEITITTPTLTTQNEVFIKGNENTLTVSGKIKEKSNIETFIINGQKVLIGEKKNGEYDFFASVDISGKDQLTMLARDEYKNEKSMDLKVVRTEINKPKISILAPYTSVDGQVFLESNEPKLFISGRVEDDSKIKSIYINNSPATYDLDPGNRAVSAQFNPEFTATIDISNKNEITVIAEDIYGNSQETIFKLNREGAGILADNPMGKTWVVIIQNSGYEWWPALDGTKTDVNTIREALANYQIHNIIVQKDMKKRDMEKYFNIELRDLIKANQVKSLLVWYAGHGKFLNDVGYWIPVDAKRDDEFTYFNINSLKAGFETYTSVVHTLIVSDACESGPGFYTAMRSAGDAPACSDVQVVTNKSAQVFSSTGYQDKGGVEKATDKSKFTTTFASEINNNLKTGNACIPIETIVNKVISTVGKENGQNPRFGKIVGMEDLNGTFFFIRK
jgi:tetratricopeptide (TPR) repeat protein